MRRFLVVLVVLMCAGGMVTPALAQKNAPLITRDSDRDGVMDPDDACRGTPAGTRVDARGCPVTAAPAPAPAPAAAPPAAAPAGAIVANQAAKPDSTRRPSGLPQPSAPPAAPPAAPPPAPSAAQPAAPSAPPAAPSGANPGAAGAAVIGAAAAAPGGRPAAAPPPAPPAAPAAAAVVTDPTETAGFWLPAYTGRTDAEQLEHARTLVIKLDSAVLALVETYRNTSGSPTLGASDPGRVTSREKARWLRCRNIRNDLSTISDAARLLRDTIAGGAAVQRAAVGLAEAFEGMQALESCDVLNSMMESPDRFNPWQQNYENEARGFYREWYPQVRAVHTSAREFARVLNGALPAARRVTVPPALPTTPPYIGAAR